MTSTLTDNDNAIKWAEKHFSGIVSTDKRRKQRVITLAALMKDSPGKSIPQLWKKSYDVKATYNLFKHPESTPDFLQKGHRELVKNKIQEEGKYIIIEDDSEFSWSGMDPIEGLGPIGDFREGLQGFMLHTCIAAKWEDSDEFNDSKRPPLKIIGIPDQQYFIRQRGVKKTQRKQGTPSPDAFKETDPWFHSMDRIGCKPKSDNVTWIRVCDRRADIFEQFGESVKRGYEYIIRNAQDRALDGCLEKGVTLSSYVKSMPLRGSLSVDIRANKGVKARTAEVEIYSDSITLRPPYRKGLKLSPCTCNIVYVKEVGLVPEGVSPIVWILLTSLPVDNFELARSVTRMYTSRWIIEEFHKTLKSGLRAEDLQLEHIDRLCSAISIMSVVAISLVELREMVRLSPGLPAKESNLSELEITILSKYLNRKLETVKDVVLAIGRLGGHMNRKSDGLPGLITLWRGWSELKTMAEGARLVLCN